MSAAPAHGPPAIWGDNYVRERGSISCRCQCTFGAPLWHSAVTARLWEPGDGACWCFQLSSFFCSCRAILGVQFPILTMSCSFVGDDVLCCCCDSDSCISCRKRCSSWQGPSFCTHLAKVNVCHRVANKSANMRHLSMLWWFVPVGELKKPRRLQEICAQLRNSHPIRSPRPATACRRRGRARRVSRVRRHPTPRPQLASAAAPRCADPAGPAARGARSSTRRNRTPRRKANGWRRTKAMLSVPWPR